MKCELKNICQYRIGKVLVNTLDNKNYVSTENMLPDKRGTQPATSLPNTAVTQRYCVGDVLVSNIRPYFKKIYFAKNDGGCSNDVLVFQPLNDVEPQYLYYVLANDEFFAYCTASSKGTKMPRGDKGAIMQYKVNLPDLETQKKIAKVLSALDDKIELNNQINKNLEEQAQALYKSWFVDFEPFGGVMPADWAQADIYSLAEVIYGAPFASKYFNNTGDGIPIIRIRDLKEQKFITYTTEKHSKGYLLQKGDIVVGMDGEFRPYIWGNSQAWLNQRVCVFKNKRPNGKAFLYYTIKPLLLAIEQTQVATTVIHIGKKDFDLFKVTLPANEILDKFDNITTPIIDQIVQNTFENKILCDIRETLLPKLMSGEIDVDNVAI